MDPNATLDWIVFYIADGDFDGAAEMGRYLSRWLSRGGFAPAPRSADAETHGWAAAHFPRLLPYLERV